MQDIIQPLPPQAQIKTHAVPLPEQRLEQWTEFLTPEQRQQIVAGILATIALRVVRNDRMRSDRIRNGHTRK